MSLYTRIGDAGSTRMPDGRMIRKGSVLLEALGDLDELNCHLGLCQVAARREGQAEVADALAPLQGELMGVSAMLAGAPCPDQSASRVVTRMEGQIDAIQRKLPELQHFVVPGGGELAARLHVARTVCRRAERAMVSAHDDGQDVPTSHLVLLNRLGDLLFALARLANFVDGVPELLWPPQRPP